MIQRRGSLTVNSVLEYITDPEFRGFCAFWERDGEPPFAFADWLRERCGDEEADAVEWARGRKEWGVEGLGASRPCRDVRQGGQTVWEWAKGNGPYRSNIPDSVFDRLPSRSHPTAYFHYSDHPTAIAEFVFAWARAKREGEL